MTTFVPFSPQRPQLNSRLHSILLLVLYTQEVFCHSSSLSPSPLATPPNMHWRLKERPIEQFCNLILRCALQAGL